MQETVGKTKEEIKVRPMQQTMERLIQQPMKRSMHINGLVSVIIPTYGGGEYLARTVESALNQKYDQLEVIVVDDNGSGTEKQKETFENIKSLLDDDRLVYVAHEKNKNGSVARNTGAKVSKGEYLLFLDDDDVIKPNNLKSQTKLLESLDQYWGMAYCSSVEYMEGAFYKKTIVKKSGDLLYELLTHSVSAATSTLLIRKSAFDTINGFDETFWRHQDYEFVARMAERYKIAANPMVGLEKFWLKRTVSNRQAYMDHYLGKMDRLIKIFNAKDQKEIIVTNQLSVAMGMLREKKYHKFLKRFVELKSGTVGVKYILKMACTSLVVNLKRKKQIERTLISSKAKVSLNSSYKANRMK